MKLFKSEALRISMIYLLITRLTLVLISYCVINEFALHNIAKNINYRFYENDILNVWGNFDTGWYLKIAQEWYPEVHDRNFSFEQFSFFPLYPGLIRLFHFITGIDYFIIGLMISNICLLISGWLMFKIAEKNYNKEIAKWSVIFMYMFPVSFIFSGVFTESLYLLLILGTIYSAFNKNWLASGLSAMFLLLCRPVGVFVFFPVSFLYYKNKNFKINETDKYVLALFLIPLGIIFLLLLNYFHAGDPLMFAHNPGYKGDVSNPLLNLYKGLRNDFFSFSFISVFTLIIIIVWLFFLKHLQFTFHMIVFYSLFIPMSYGLMSMPRMMLVAFPLFILLASVAVKYKTQNIFVIMLSLFQGYLFVCWCLGFGNVI
jgi:Gpi18-like mannosyltransferase